MKLLFVCSGNICRSPMAAEIARQRAAASGLQDWTIDSAGTLNILGCPASPEAVQAVGELGADLTGHRSKGLDEHSVTSTQLVIAMAGEHIAVLKARFPEWHGRRYLLRAFEAQSRPAPQAPDLEDPIGEALPVYRRQVELITRCVDHLLDYLARRP